MNDIMRHSLIAAALVFFTFVPADVAAQERQYPWCARYDWTTYNCGFVSLGQCMATVQGAGGRCEPNPRYVPGEPRRKKQNRY